MELNANSESSTEIEKPLACQTEPDIKIRRCLTRQICKGYPKNERDLDQANNSSPLGFCASFGSSTIRINSTGKESKKR
jgi:hypothetical protein